MKQCINAVDFAMPMKGSNLPAESSGYSSPKRAILVLLKRQPDASLEEIARGLGISKVAALSHLQKLEGNGLIERSYRAGKVGRPRVQFRLSTKSSSLFPQGYTEMSLSALEFIERRLGRNAVAELLSQRSIEVAERHRARIPTGSLSHRVEELAQVRTEGGYMAEVGGRGRGPVELREYNCPILAIAGRFPEACDTERRMFETLLRADVKVSHRVVAGDGVCRFLIREKRTAP